MHSNPVRATGMLIDRPWAKIVFSQLLAWLAALVCVALHMPLLWMIGPLMATAIVSMLSDRTQSWTPLRNAGQ